MIYRIANEDELYHYGVKGMKWGVRKQIQARHRFNKSSKSLAKNTASSYQNKVKNLYAKQQKEGSKIGDWGSSSGRKLQDKHISEMRTLTNNGKKAVNYSALLDAGYSKEQAAIGAEWMMKNGYIMYNVSWSRSMSK